MRKRFLLLTVSAVIAMLLLSNCSNQYTKEFLSVFPPAKKGDLQDIIDGWIIEVPGVVAYKDLKSIDGIDNPDMYWFTIRTRYPLQKNIAFDGTFEIDSIGVIMYGIDSTLLKEVGQDKTQPTPDFVVWDDGTATPLMRIDTVLKDKRIQHVDTIEFHHFNSDYFYYSYSLNSRTPSDIFKGPMGIKLSAYNDNVVANDSFFVEHSTVWRTPSRVAPFRDSRNKYQHIAFDFFRDKGVIIPDDIVRLKLFFKVSVVGTSGTTTEKELSYYMLKYETSEKIPFMLQ